MRAFWHKKKTINSSIVLLQVIQFIEANKRLNIPEDCPEKIKVIIQQCWLYQPERQPTFKYLYNSFCTDPYYTDIWEDIKDWVLFYSLYMSSKKYFDSFLFLSIIYKNILGCILYLYILFKSIWLAFYKVFTCFVHTDFIFYFLNLEFHKWIILFFKIWHMLMHRLVFKRYEKYFILLKILELFINFFL